MSRGALLRVGHQKRVTLCKPLGYHNGYGKLQRWKAILDEYFNNLPRTEYVVSVPEHTQRALYTGMRNVYDAYHREDLPIKDIFGRGDVYGFQTPTDFATFASSLNLGAIALCCESGDKTTKLQREKLLEEAMTSAIKFCLYFSYKVA